MGLFVIIWQISYNGRMNSTRKINMAKKPSNQICANKKARHEYFIEETFEAGLSLEGWEVKSIRAGKMAITDAYVIFKNGEAFLFGAHIQPLLSSSTHINPDNIRTRKLLLHRKQIDKLFGMALFLCHATGKAVVSNVKLP